MSGRRRNREEEEGRKKKRERIMYKKLGLSCTKLRLNWARMVRLQNLHLKVGNCIELYGTVRKQIKLISCSIKVVFAGGCLPSFQKMKIKLKIVLSLT